MNISNFSDGDFVRVTDGTYAGAEGVVEDLQPECSAVRVHTKAGNVYAYVQDLDKVVKPMPVRKTNALVKR